MSNTEHPSTGSLISHELEEVIQRFEDAWLSGDRPAIEAYLPSGDIRSLALQELVHIDLERRLKSGEPTRVEEYLVRFPELARQDAVVLELLSAERELRHRRAPNDSIAEYQRRFPQFAAALAARLGSTQPTRPRRAKRLNCPDCRQPIETIDDGTGSSVTCPSCGSTFTLDRVLETSWQTARLPQIGKFQLLDAAGRGSFGTVYRARDTELDRIVAVKVPRSGQLVSSD